MTSRFGDSCGTQVLGVSDDCKLFSAVLRPVPTYEVLTASWVVEAGVGTQGDCELSVSVVADLPVELVTRSVKLLIFSSN